MRWNGHTDQPIANWQPKTGWLPLRCDRLVLVEKPH